MPCRTTPEISFARAQITPLAPSTLSRSARSGPSARGRGRALEELEILRLGVEGKAAGWRTLQTLADTDTRLDPARLDQLISRARSGQIFSKTSGSAPPTG